jgi:hypothetical protein
VRDQVARHNPLSGVYNGSYINEYVQFNVQDAFLESEVTEDGLTRAFAHMSLRCHPGAPSGVAPELLHQLLAADPEIARLEREAAELHNLLRAKYTCIKYAPEKERQEHKDCRQRLTNAKKNLTDLLNDACRRDYFTRVHDVMMEMQRNQTMVEEPGDEPMVQHQLEERNRLQKVLCDFSRDLSPQEIVSRKVLATNLLVALASRQEPQTRKPGPACQDPVKKESPSPAPSPEPFPKLNQFPLTLGKTQCIFCIGNERYSYERRTRAFKRPSHMLDHVENVHLKHLGQLIPCGHPVCKAQGVVLGVEIFKNHVATVHKINLRP